MPSLQSKNQTVMLSDVKQETEFVHNTEIPQLKSNISLNYGALAALSRTVNQGLNPLQQQVQNIASSVASLKNQTTRLGTDALTQVGRLCADDVSFSDVDDVTTGSHMSLTSPIFCAGSACR